MADVVNVSELAAILGIGKNQAYEFVNSGQIRSVRVGRRRLIPRKELDRLLMKESLTLKEPSTSPESSKPLEPSIPLVNGKSLRVRRGGARLSQEQFDELIDITETLSKIAQQFGDQVMRLRRVRDEVVKKRAR